MRVCVGYVCTVTMRVRACARAFGYGRALAARARAGVRGPHGGRRDTEEGTSLCVRSCTHGGQRERRRERNKPSTHTKGACGYQAESDPLTSSESSQRPSWDMHEICMHSLYVCFCRTYCIAVCGDMHANRVCVWQVCVGHGERLRAREQAWPARRTQECRTCTNQRQDFQYCASTKSAHGQSVRRDMSIVTALG